MCSCHTRATFDSFGTGGGVSHASSKWIKSITRWSTAALKEFGETRIQRGLERWLYVGESAGICALHLSLSDPGPAGRPLHRHIQSLRPVVTMTSGQVSLDGPRPGYCLQSAVWDSGARGGVALSVRQQTHSLQVNAAGFQTPKPTSSAPEQDNKRRVSADRKRSHAVIDTVYILDYVWVNRQISSSPRGCFINWMLSMVCKAFWRFRLWCWSSATISTVISGDWESC